MSAEDAVSDDEVEEVAKPLAKTAANEAAEASKVRRIHRECFAMPLYFTCSTKVRGVAACT